VLDPRRRRNEEAHQADRQHEPLNTVGPGDRSQAAQRFVDHDYQHQPQDTGPVRDPVAGETGHDVSHCHELRQQVVGDRDNEKEIGEEGKRRGAETVVHPVAGGHVAAVLGQSVKAGRKEQIDDNDSHHEADGHHPGEAQAIRLTRVAEQGVAAVLGCIQCQQEDETAQSPTGQVEVAQGLAASSASGHDTEPEHQYQVEGEKEDRTEPEGEVAHSSSPRSSSSSIQKRRMTKTVKRAIPSVAAREMTTQWGSPSQILSDSSRGRYQGIAIPKRRA
jgi:hypothetical protein